MKWSKFMKISGLLLWKNLKSRSARLCLTFMEIIMPILILSVASTGLQVYFGNYTISHVPIMTNMTSAESSQIIADLMAKNNSELAKNILRYARSTNDVLTELKIKGKKPYKSPFDLRFRETDLVYTPENEFTRKIVSKIPDKLFKKISAVNSEIEMEKLWAEKILQHGRIKGLGGGVRHGIVFKNGFENPYIARNFSYKIRTALDMDNHLKFKANERKIVKRTKNKKSRITREEFKNYKHSKFLLVQKLIDDCIISQVQIERNLTTNISSSITEFENKLYEEPELAFYGETVPMLLAGAVVILFIFTSLSIIGLTIFGIVHEKESGLKEFLQMMGIPGWIQTLQWFINSLIFNIFIIIIGSICITTIFKDGHKNPIVDLPYDIILITLVVYILQCTSYAILIASIFNSAVLGISVGILVWILSFLSLFGMFMDSYKNALETFSYSGQTFFAILPNMGLFQVFYCGTNKWGQRNIGYSQSDLAKMNNLISPWTIICMMILSILVMLLMSLYFEQIIPSKFGTSKPWHFIFKEKSAKIESKLKLEASILEAFEKDPNDLEVGIRLDNLKKKFGQKVVLDGISMKMFKGQITAILGKNGAGKTTLISILGGLCQSTGGKAFIGDFDIDKDMDKIRQNLGFCPQQNILFRDLKGKDQLVFFSALKGKSIKEAQIEVARFGELTKLSEYFEKRPDKLSGGQRRQLQLGIALIGNPSVVILDEPTSGLDPENRRCVLQILQNFRQNRTIILTTHHMDEAELLCDRLAIITQGQVQCIGSVNFLKNFYGNGYTLHITLEDLSKSDRILHLIKSHLGSGVKLQKSNSDHVLQIYFQNADNTSAKFPKLFQHLEEFRIEFGIREIEFRETIMEDVFIKVAESRNTDCNAEDIEDLWLNSKSAKIEGPKLLFQRFCALLLTRTKIYSRSYGLLLIMFIIPLICIICGFFLNFIPANSSQSEPSLKIDQTLYQNNPWRILYLAKNSPKFEQIFKNQVGSQNIQKLLEVNQSFEMEIERIQSEIDTTGIKKNIEDFKKMYIFGVEFENDTSVRGFTSKCAIHSEPLVQNLMSNIIIKSINENYSIFIDNHPFDLNLYTRFHEFPLIETSDEYTNPDNPNKDHRSMKFALILSLGLIIMGSSFVLFPAEENSIKSKHLQYICGVSPFLYHISGLFGDFLIIISVYLIAGTFLLCTDSYGTFTQGNGLSILLLIMTGFWLSASVLAQLFSLFSQVPAKSFAHLFLYHLVTGLGVFTLLIVTLTEYHNLFKIFPIFDLTRALHNYSKLSIANSKCQLIPQDDLDLMCSIKNMRKSKISRMCCSNCVNFSYILDQNQKILPKCFEKKEFDFENFYSYIFAMFILALVFWTLLMILEYKDSILMKCRGNQMIMKFRKGADDDVRNEACRVNELTLKGDFKQDKILVQDLKKNFGKFRAVNNISFGVQKGECFGLLGVNGAGKSTAFSMITGLLKPSWGNAYQVQGNLQKGRGKYFKEIGFCPQFDGTCNVLTGQEILEIYALIRGVPYKSVKKEASNWLKRFGLSESGPVQIGKYSGGMSRRLSCAISMIGNPSILMLDEPTSGVDPLAKRSFWKVIGFIRKNKSSVILTTHSMDECEKMCSKLAIMVNGEFQCFGSVQQIKSKFAPGFQITINCTHHPTDLNHNSPISGTGNHHQISKSISYHRNPDFAQFNDEMLASFESTILREQNGTLIIYEVQKNMPWDMLWTIMEKLKNKYPNLIRDYKIVETSLEDVFINFAQKQRSPRGSNKFSFCYNQCICCMEQNE